MAMLTFRYRIKDSTSGTHLQRMAWAVNHVWNFCNEVSLLAWRREKRFLIETAMLRITYSATDV